MDKVYIVRRAHRPDLPEWWDEEAHGSLRPYADRDEASSEADERSNLLSHHAGTIREFHTGSLYVVEELEVTQ